MNITQRKFIADKLGNLGNFAIVAMVFGQVIGKEPIRLSIFLLGFFLWLVCNLGGYYILEGGE